MKRNDFEVCIVGGMEIPAAGVVKLPHGQEYKLAFTNHGTRRCEASAEIDGRPVGHWPVPPRCTLVVAAPAGESEPFTFLRPDSDEAKMAGVATDRKFVGLTVLFTPEKLADICLLSDVPVSSLPADVPLEHIPAATAAPFRPDLDAALEVGLRLVHGAVPSVEVQAQDRRWQLRREIIRLRKEADKFAEEDFDYAMARKLDNERFEMQIELALLDWQTQVFTAPVASVPVS